MNSVWKGYMHHYGNSQQHDEIQRELLREMAITEHVANIVNLSEHSRLIERVQLHMKSICVELNRAQIQDYEWWIETYILHDNTSSRYQKFIEEYKLLQNEAILHLKDLEGSEEKEYFYKYDRYIAILQKMYEIYFIKNGLRDNQREPPDNV